MDKWIINRGDKEMKRWMYFILFIFLLAMGALIGTKQTSLFQEHEVRGAIDIGSGTKKQFLWDIKNNLSNLLTIALMIK